MYFHLGWIETPLETHPRKIETAVVVSTMWKIINAKNADIRLCIPKNKGTINIPPNTTFETPHVAF